MTNHIQKISHKKNQRHTKEEEEEEEARLQNHTRDDRSLLLKDRSLIVFFPISDFCCLPFS
ncbi:hypothetical protein RchiOBHm_Chr3g0452561 [Rosa chinensis]|uniref:Uncharacterized protein n=1 Tax=Rosa chinensis TaxID=74649 RepID=A0A2P6R6A9_ROSCH|nr:hypothetical protein RchiOBHm_Chr3g0452561 [Rosa chinensis]